MSNCISASRKFLTLTLPLRKARFDVANTVSDVLSGRTDGNTIDKLKDASLNGEKTKADQKAEKQAEAAERAVNKEAF